MEWPKKKKKKKTKTKKRNKRETIYPCLMTHFPGRRWHHLGFRESLVLAEEPAVSSWIISPNGAYSRMLFAGAFVISTGTYGINFPPWAVEKGYCRK